MNHKLFDFGNAARTQKVTPGCSLLHDDEQMEEEEEEETEDMSSRQKEEPPRTRDPCISNLCRRGSKCVSKRPGEYVCRCQPGFSGKYCDKRKSASSLLRLMKPTRLPCSPESGYLDIKVYIIIFL